MPKENISQEFRLKNIKETRNYFIKEIDQNEFMSSKHKKISTTLDCNTLLFWFLQLLGVFQFLLLLLYLASL